jgi:hypothetical protein
MRIPKIRMWGLRRPHQPRSCNPVRLRDRGATAVVLSVLIGGGALLPVGAIVVDVGSLYIESQELLTGAEAAAMAVAQECSAGHCTATDLATQLVKATKEASRNAKDGKATVSALCGRWAALPVCPTQDQTKIGSCIGGPPAGNYVEVQVQTLTADDKSVMPPILAQTLLGNETYDGTRVGACARTAENDVCVTVDKETYTHTFVGPSGEASIKANRPLCKGQSQPFTLVSYTAPAASFALPQYLYDYSTKSITSDTRTITFKVDVPQCFTQVDLVFGSEAVNPLTYAAYGDKKLGSSGPPGNRSSGPPGWYNGGTRACAPKPTVSAAAGSGAAVKLTLGNQSTANVDAVFTVKSGGNSTIYRVAKGTTKVVNVATVDGTVQVQDNVVDGSEFKWVTYHA